jgi:hypothetical protein
LRYCLLQGEHGIECVAIPADHMYQFVALNRRLHKEIDKLTSKVKPYLPDLIAECTDIEVHSPTLTVYMGLDYVTKLEEHFAKTQENEYPLISLLTEIRAFQAQLEYLEEEGEL